MRQCTQVPGTKHKNIYTKHTSSTKVVAGDVFFMGRPWREEYKGGIYRVIN
ncbi:MAG: hypothetical protein WBL93_13600 [Lutisporaceae bacterium]